MESKTGSPSDHLGFAIEVLNRFIRRYPSAERFRDDLRSACYAALVFHWDSYDPELGEVTTYMNYKLWMACQQTYLGQAWPIKFAHNHFSKYGAVPQFCYESSDVNASDIDTVNLIDTKRDISDMYDALGELPDIDRDTLVTYYGLYDSDPHTLTELGDREDVAHQAIAHRLERAIKHLRAKMLSRRAIKCHKRFISCECIDV